VYLATTIYNIPLLYDSLSNWIFIYNYSIYNIPLLNESLSNWIFPYQCLQYSPVEWIPQKLNIYLHPSTIFLCWKNFSETEYFTTSVYNIPLLNESLSNWIFIYNYLQYSSIEWIPQQLNISLQESTKFPCWMNLSETEYLSTTIYNIPLLNESLSNWIFIYNYL
jgi:hypothetical protein